MRVSTQFPVAVHIMLMIAGFPEKKITSEDASDSTGCNPVIIRNIFAKLRKAGLLNTKSGRGRTTITKPADDITLWDIYSAVESDDTEELFKFHQRTSPSCPVGKNIHGLLVPHLNNAVSALRVELTTVSLGDIVRELEAVTK